MNTATWARAPTAPSASTGSWETHKPYNAPPGSSDNRQREEPHDYKTGLSDEERRNVELMAFNFHAAFGKRLRVPPSMYSDLKRGGVDMSNIQEDPHLETRGFTSQ